MVKRNSDSYNAELDAHLGERLPQLAQQARTAHDTGRKWVEDATHQAIDLALDGWVRRNGKKN